MILVYCKWLLQFFLQISIIRKEINRNRFLVLHWFIPKTDSSTSYFPLAYPYADCISRSASDCSSFEYLPRP
jgi:hypothetical protein